MREELRVVIDGVIFQTESRGGVSRVFQEILPRLADLDDSLALILLYRRGELCQHLPAHPRIRARRLPQLKRYLRPGRVWDRLLPRGIRGLQARLDSAIVGSGEGQVWHSTYFTPPPMGWRGAEVVTVHDMMYERYPDLFDASWLEGARARRERCVRSADLIIAISETTAADLVEIYGIERDRIRVIGHAPSPVFRKLEDSGGEGYPSGRPFLLYVGNRSHYKQFETLLTAYTRWPDRKDTDLVAVGGGEWSHEERARLHTLSLTDRVHRLGGVSDEALCRLYNQADAFVYPSLYEGFGLPLLEAMACGCPIVASRIPSTVEVAGNVPLYFEPADPESLLCAIEATGGPEAAAHVARGRERVSRFSWDFAAARTLTAYRDSRSRSTPASAAGPAPDR